MPRNTSNSHQPMKNVGVSAYATNHEFLYNRRKKNAEPLSFIIPRLEQGKELKSRTFHVYIYTYLQSTTSYILSFEFFCFHELCCCVKRKGKRRRSSKSQSLVPFKGSKLAADVPATIFAERSLWGWVGGLDGISSIFKFSRNLLITSKDFSPPDRLPALCQILAFDKKIYSKTPPQTRLMEISILK